MKIDLAAILAEPEKHLGSLKRVEDVVTEKLAPKIIKAADVAPEGETDLEAAKRSLKRRHPDIHRKMMNLD
jgi:hypothetical protein